MSDLHLELTDNSRYIKNNEFPVTGDVLVLAGDIFYLRNDVAPLGRFWKWASANYRQVLIVPGNHDYYGRYDVMTKGMQWSWKFKKNVGYYQNQVVRIDNVDFILSTLWSHIPPMDEYAVSHVEKPRAFDPRGRVVLTPSDKIALTLRVEIKMTPEKQTFFRGFL